MNIVGHNQQEAVSGLKDHAKSTTVSPLRMAGYLLAQDLAKIFNAEDFHGISWIFQMLLLFLAYIQATKGSPKRLKDTKSAHPSAQQILDSQELRDEPKPSTALRKRASQKSCANLGKFGVNSQQVM